MEWIYDRTQADVYRVKELNKKYMTGTITADEKAEWSAGMKGALNISDLNRIESNLEIIAAQVAAVVQVKNWNIGDIPRVSDYLRILENVKSVRDAWMTFSDTPDTPIQPLNTFQKWNDIEKILRDVSYSYERVVNSYEYCDDGLYAGEGIGII